MARLRDCIDHGLTGDKVAWPDPATAPLGTDEEAAGAPCPPSAAATARALEMGRGLHLGAGRRTGDGAVWIMVAIVVAASAGVVCWLLSAA